MNEEEDKPSHLRRPTCAIRFMTRDSVESRKIMAGNESGAKSDFMNYAGATRWINPCIK